MQFMELRDNQAAPRIMPGEQAGQINATTFGLKIFIRRNGRAALPPTIGHGDARMPRRIGAQKRIKIGDGKQPRVTTRRAPWQKPPSRAFTQREDLLRR